MAENHTIRPICLGSADHEPRDAYALCDTHSAFLCIQCLIEKRHLQSDLCNVIDLSNFTTKYDRAKIERIMFTQEANNKIASRENEEETIGQARVNIAQEMEKHFEQLKAKLQGIKDKCQRDMCDDFDKQLQIEEVKREKDILERMETSLQDSIDVLLEADKKGAMDSQSPEFFRYREQERHARSTVAHLKKENKTELVSRFDLAPNLVDILSGRKSLFGKTVFTSSIRK
ncbi:hypothetical protein DPMN_114917 [Dreissena polymorpha]|uniref:Uncharacterized protein n=1 Tax=Dreissena polymorpha TaxID=45954 RepID=A0A9D4QSG9_DREPO|nr:hypothetical protein DPMN_114917 [Dreissena polymorpha]